MSVGIKIWNLTKSVNALWGLWHETIGLQWPTSGPDDQVDRRRHVEKVIGALAYAYCCRLVENHGLMSHNTLEGITRFDHLWYRDARLYAYRDAVRLSYPNIQFELQPDAIINLGREQLLRLANRSETGQPSRLNTLKRWADFFAISTAERAAALRHHGTTDPIAGRQAILNVTDMAIVAAAYAAGDAEMAKAEEAILTDLARDVIRCPHQAWLVRRIADRVCLRVDTIDRGPYWRPGPLRDDPDGRYEATDWLATNDKLALGLATDIRNNRVWNRFPVLGDALQDAGCTDQEILTHCYAEKPHCRDCWLLHLLLGDDPVSSHSSHSETTT